MSATLHRIPQWKVELVNELYELAKKHKVIALADITGIPANHVQMLRKKLHGKAVLKAAKAKVALIALEKAGIDLKEHENHFTGQILLIFTDMNPFELNSLVEQHVTKAYYKPGEITDKEIMIPEGNTGISPGPILSVFGKLKIPTKVQGNVIHVAKDTVVAKPGDVVSPELSSLLQRLGMALKEIRLKLGFAYDGIMIPGDKLRLNLEEYEGMLRACALDGLKVAVEIVWPIPEAIELALGRAHRQSLMLAAEAGFIAPETAEFIVRAAELRALALAAEVSKLAPELGIQVAAPAAQAAAQPAAEEKKEEKEEKEEEVSEESLAEGFSALFG